MGTHRHSGWSMVFAGLLLTNLIFFGCATSAQMKALEARVDEALKKAEIARNEAAASKTEIETIRASSQATGEAEKAAISVYMAKDEAERAEKAAKTSEAWARKAEEMAKQSEGYYLRIRKK